MRLENVRAIKGLVIGGALRESGDHTKLRVPFYVAHVANRRIRLRLPAPKSRDHVDFTKCLFGTTRQCICVT